MEHLPSGRRTPVLMSRCACLCPVRRTLLMCVELDLHARAHARRLTWLSAPRRPEGPVGPIRGRMAEDIGLVRLQRACACE